MMESPFPNEEIASCIRKYLNLPDNIVVEVVRWPKGEAMKPGEVWRHDVLDFISHVLRAAGKSESPMTIFLPIASSVLGNRKKGVAGPEDYRYILVGVLKKCLEVLGEA